MWTEKQMIEGHRVEREADTQDEINDTCLPIL